MTHNPPAPADEMIEEAAKKIIETFCPNIPGKHLAAYDAGVILKDLCRRFVESCVGEELPNDEGDNGRFVWNAVRSQTLTNAYRLLRGKE